ncbi:L,D-transpeptidase family protein [Hoeflea sp. YIM 152468]|uniref:L,D-transpeptidase family protein n=1 Tax=Hoeflea sp. YIM 152468 TaxID=3031759 RepID=UPI0023DBB83C|nr:L,D-transpeptidase family protein [Hoeflea sp. YIM 152468]MDF1607367.1 L,D-transpeptidase family protein [Hoeflea sp. YIM 152468]
MSIKMRAGVAMIAIAVTFTGVVSVPPPVQAQGLLDALFKNPAQRNRERLARQRAREEAAAPPVVTKPIPRISGPSYRTYKPDALVKVDFSKIADPVVTGSIDGLDLPPLGIDPFLEGRPALADLSLKALPEAADAVIEHYSANPDYIWVAGTSVTGHARAVIEVLETADRVGLSPADYMVEVPADGFDITRGTERQKELMVFEMKLSVAVANYMLDATRGRIDPNRISGYHDFKRKSPDLAKQLEALAKAADPAEALLAQNPQGGHFEAMKAELKRLKDLDDGARIAIAQDLMLKPGQSNPELSNVMAAIAIKGSDALKADNALLFASYAGKPEYDSELVSLVKGFQKEAGLTPDGVVGPATRRALVGITNADKIEKLLLSMERARWLPGVLAAKRVFINQPAYTATYYEAGKSDLSMRVVVGTRANQTNFFDDEIEIVEFNPYWGVPQSIIFNEMMPKLRSDPSYLDRLGYEVTLGGKRVSSSNINWSTVGRGSNVGVRQPPSNGNALGELKILFPNRHAIYMHDTPSKSLFERDTRAYSHGCIRLQDPRAMAAKVLGTTVDDIGSQIAGGQNKPVSVPHKIPVHVAYFTAWPDDDGTVEYFADVYGRDSYLRKAIDATEAARAS